MNIFVAMFAMLLFIGAGCAPTPATNTPAPQPQKPVEEAPVSASAGENGRISWQTDDEPTEDRSFSGTVTSVDVEKMMVDGPGVVFVNTKDGSEATVLVPSMGFGMCAAKDSIANVYDLKAGDKVEARGSIGAEKGTIVPCRSKEHYLRVIKK